MPRSVIAVFFMSFLAGCSEEVRQEAGQQHLAYMIKVENNQVLHNLGWNEVIGGSRSNNTCPTDDWIICVQNSHPAVGPVLYVMDKWQLQAMRDAKIHFDFSWARWAKQRMMAIYVATVVAD